MPSPHIQKIETKNLTWIDISRVGQVEMSYLEKNFGVRPLHASDCLSKIQRPKLASASKYIFMVLLFPLYHRKTRKITPAEIDFFISSHTLITVHRNELSSLINFFNRCQISKSQQEKYFTGSPATLLYEILNRLFSYCGPILDNIHLNTESIEENIFRGNEKRMVREILISKTNIVNFRKIMQVHRAIISKLIEKSSTFFSAGKLKAYFEELIETTEDIWQNLENMNQTIEALERTNNSLISYQLNDVIKILTTISVIVLPITLLASIFGMNLKFMPFIEHPLAFWLIVGLMGLAFLVIIFFFKKRKWL
ncbi:magnesium transporter CorA family protein [Patescibacteria group bacterium AH-259-L05]|nr:magnesium transporter CorA family protein [Patescibacteria group bacterium AH-259-L05]